MPYKNNEDRKAYDRSRREKNPEEYRNWYIMRDYGITGEQYSEMLSQQNGLCAICKKPETLFRHGKVSKLCIDHDHITGKIRKLLCNHCNSGLGKFFDDPNMLRLAAKYLEDNK